MQTHDPNVMRDAQGANRCRRVKKGVVLRDKKNPNSGYVPADVYCNKPMLLSVADNRNICPDCEKEPPIGWVKPKITSAADIKLTKRELEECGFKDGIDPSSLPPSEAPKEIEATVAVEAKVSEVKKDAVVLTIPLTELEGDADIAALLIQKVVASFGTLPVTNYAESKRLMKLEEKLEALLRA